MFCNHCGAENPDEAVSCMACGQPQTPVPSSSVTSSVGGFTGRAMSEQQNPSLLAETVADSALTTMYFPVSPLKLMVMSVCTFGLYEIYWFYKNWCSIKEREKLDITPFWRAWFAPFFCYSLFKRIQHTAESRNLQTSVSPGLFTTGWIGCSVLYRLRDPYWLFSFASVLFLLPAATTVNAINRATNQKYDANSHFSWSNIVIVVIGGLVAVLASIGTFLPSK
jgi:hypothetical protein